MRTKRKLSITVDYKLLEEIEKASKVHHFSKSRLTEEALKLWFKKIQKSLWPEGIKKWLGVGVRFIRPASSVGQASPVFTRTVPPVY